MVAISLTLARAPPALAGGAGRLDLLRHRPRPRERASCTPDTSSTHDRYSYLSCLGWALLVGAAVGAMASRGRGAARCAPGSRAVAAVAAAPGSSPSGPSRGIKYRYGGTPRPCGATRWNPIPTCSICQNNVGVFYYRQRLYPPAKEQVRAGPGAAARPLAGARQSGPRAARAWATSTAPCATSASRWTTRPTTPRSSPTWPTCS